MQIELVSPCLLHLGCIWAEQVCELGITLQYPQIQLSAQSHPQLEISGACADMALIAVKHLIGKYHQPLPATVEIESAIPIGMGLGAQSMMAESMRQVYSKWHPFEGSFRTSLAGHAAKHGGLLLSNDDGLLQTRADLATHDDSAAWVFVLVLPNLPDDAPEDIESQQLACLCQACRPKQAGANSEELFAAAEQNDFAAFAHALAQIQAANEAVLNIPITAEEHTALDILRSTGAAMCGRALTGRGLFGLVQGGPASRDVRAALQHHYGYFGPQILAATCQNHGITVNTNPMVARGAF